MEAVKNIPLFAIVLSLFSGVLCTMLKNKAARIYTVLFECALIAGMALVLIYTLQTGTSFTYVMGEFPAPWGNEIRAGALEAGMALLFLIVMLMSVIAGMHYLDDMDASRVHLYAAWHARSRNAAAKRAFGKFSLRFVPESLVDEGLQCSQTTFYQ